MICSVKMHMLLLVTLMLASIKGEFFTSMANMEQLVLTEKYMMSYLKQYIEAEERKVVVLKNFMTRVEDALQYVNDTDIGKYLGNPVNSYLMLKRFTVDWKNLEDILATDTAGDFTAVFDQMRPYFPSEEDYKGAMTALFRLQDTYNLPSDKLAKGVIPGVKQSQQHLDMREIFELGRHAYNAYDWTHSRDWMRTALTEIGNKPSVLDVKRSHILDFLAYSEFKSGNIKEAFHLTQELAKLEPGEQRIHDNLEYFRQELRALQGTGTRGDSGLLNDDTTHNHDRKRRAATMTEETVKRVNLQNYEQLCRGEVRKQSKYEQSKMVCWYNSDDPLLRIQPQKVERIWLNPEIFMLRDIVTDSQIRKIKESAYPKLNRATIQDPLTGELRYADYRVSKSAWLHPAEHDFVREVATRVQAATNLDMRSSEQLQLSNYGIGGHYEPHFDHARENEDKFTDLGLGNRIATVLFYLSDVEAGGATVFTYARTAIFPSKGDAVFWYNLKKNGLGNSKTRHAGCPVLVGQKWVGNFWIHEYGQEFRRKCALDENL